MISTLYRNIARTHQQHWHIHNPQHLFGHAAERELADAGSSVGCHGDEINMRGLDEIGNLLGRVAELLQWLAPMARGRPKVILTHGEERGRVPLERCIAARFGISAELPLLEDIVADGD